MTWNECKSIRNYQKQQELSEIIRNIQIELAADKAVDVSLSNPLTKYPHAMENLSL